MKKKGAVQIIVIIILVLSVIGAIIFFTKDVPEFVEDISNNPCLPINSKLDLCISNTTGIVLIGDMDKELKFILIFHDRNITCAVGKDYLNLRTACKDEFGYFYEKREFNIEVYEANNLIKTMSQVELNNVLFRALSKPEKIGKAFGKGAEGLFALRGLIYIAENWNNTVNK